MLCTCPTNYRAATSGCRTQDQNNYQYVGRCHFLLNRFGSQGIHNPIVPKFPGSMSKYNIICFSWLGILHSFFPFLTYVYFRCNSLISDSSLTPYTLVLIFFNHKFFHLSQTSQEISGPKISNYSSVGISQPFSTYTLYAPAYACPLRSYCS
jgi:hypothetical protein